MQRVGLRSWVAKRNILQYDFAASHIGQAKQTIDDNARFFERSEDVPNYAITMGVGTILEARKIMLLANGQAKAEAIANAAQVGRDLADDLFPFPGAVTVALSHRGCAALPPGRPGAATAIHRILLPGNLVAPILEPVSL